VFNAETQRRKDAERIWPFSRSTPAGSPSTIRRMSAKLTLGFLGAGKMATALAKGFVQGKLADADEIIASDPIDAARSAFAKEVGAETTASNLEVMKFAGVLLLAVKPDQVADVLKEIRGQFGAKHL